MPTRADIKAYFEKGERPSEANFSAMIDRIPMVDSAAGTIEYWDETLGAFVTKEFTDCMCLKEHSQVVTSAELLASNTHPVVLVPAPPVGFAHDVISVIASADGNFIAPPYATNTTLEVISDGATVAMFTSNFLASTTNRIVKFTPNGVSVASNSNVVTGDLLLKTFGGDPTAGTYDIKVYVVYREFEL
jgi:hypothetical protein